MRINEILSDDDIEECIDGSSDVTMIREIIDLTQMESLVNEKDFADLFADRISGFIAVDYDEEPDEWETCNDNNWSWGKAIAENINDKILEKWDN